jgi:hypothetical protein
MSLLIINEAITTLLGVVRRTPDAELALYEPSVRELKRLAVVEILGPVNDSWPISASATPERGT